MQTVFDAAGGLEGLRRLAMAWHRRVLADEVVSHAFSHGFHPEHIERLAAYWAEALGGPTFYSDGYGGDETTVVRMHSGNGEHTEMDRRAIACFDQALGDAGLAGEAALSQALHDYFAWATTASMARYPRTADDVPHGTSASRIGHGKVSSCRWSFLAGSGSLSQRSALRKGPNSWSRPIAVVPVVGLNQTACAG